MSKSLMPEPDRRPVRWTQHRVKPTFFQGVVIVLGELGLPAEDFVQDVLRQMEELLSEHERIPRWSEEMTWIFDARPQKEAADLVPRRVLVGLSMMLDETLGEAAALIMDHNRGRRYGIWQN